MMHLRLWKNSDLALRMVRSFQKSKSLSDKPKFFSSRIHSSFPISSESPSQGGSGRLKVLYLGYVWPEINSSAAGLRTWNLLQAFGLKKRETIVQKNGNEGRCDFKHEMKHAKEIKNQSEILGMLDHSLYVGRNFSCEIYFSSSARRNHHTQVLETFSNVSTLNFPLNDSRLDEWLQAERPDVVIFDRFVTEEQYGFRVADKSPDSIRILDTQDLHFLRKHRQIAVEQGACSMETIVEGNLDMHSADTWRELSSIYRCDCSLVISDFERDLLMKKFGVPEFLLLLLRFSYPETSMASFRSFEERTHMTMIGNFRHAPNADGVRWFSREILPLIRRELPTIQAHIYGAYPSNDMMRLSEGHAGLEVRGYVANHFQMLQKYRLNLAPLRFGAGIKGKITDGWYCGTPAVMTPIAAEGMTENLPWGGAIAMHPEEFARQVVKLYTNKDLWIKCQANGQIILDKLYNAEVNCQKFLDRVFDIRGRLREWRRQNIMGEILQYEMNRSTKYFSLWIEEKSRRAKI